MKNANKLVMYCGTDCSYLAKVSEIKE